MLGRVRLDLVPAIGEAVSNYTWGKDRAATGHWNRNKHEHLLIGVKGNIPAPALGTQWDSLIIPLKHGFYGGIKMTDEIALIHLELSRQPAPAHLAARRARRRSAARPRP